MLKSRDDEGQTWEPIPAGGVHEGNGEAQSAGRTRPEAAPAEAISTGPSGTAEAPGAFTDRQSERALSGLPIVLAITGASGAPYAVRLLEVLAAQRVPVWLLVSSHGWRLLREECNLGTPEALQAATGGDWSTVTHFPDSDRGARPASGSQRTRGMVICPCSMGTVAAIAAGTSRSLVERAADVTLKERRRLILVPRETPLSLVHLRNLTAAAEAGATIIPASPGFYHRPAAVSDLVDFMVQRILDHLDLPIELSPRWSG